MPDALHGDAQQDLLSPRLILPLSAVIGKLVDLVVISILFIPVMLWYGYVPRIEAIVVVPSLILVLVLTCLASALWLSALAVQYRDVSHAVGICHSGAHVHLAGGLLGPYGARAVPRPLRLESGRRRDRWHSRGGARDRPSALGPHRSRRRVALVLRVSGLYYFRSRERIFADVA